MPSSVEILILGVCLESISLGSAGERDGPRLDCKEGGARWPGKAISDDRRSKRALDLARSGEAK